MPDLQFTQMPYPQGADSTRNLLARLAQRVGLVGGVSLTAAARTADTWSPSVLNAGFESMLVWLGITVASGTGGLRLFLQGTNLGSTWASLNSAIASPIITTGLYIWYFSVTGASVNTSTAVQQTVTAIIPATFRFYIQHGDATSYNYSVVYQLS